MTDERAAENLATVEKHFAHLAGPDSMLVGIK